MKLSYNWLRAMTPVTAAPKEYIAAMTMSGSKVETLDYLGAEIENVVVGRVLAMEHHPDADKLWICSVDAGQGSVLQIVTGAQNVSVGDLVPVALDGSKLPGGVEIHTGELRGVRSEGMLPSGAGPHRARCARRAGARHPAAEQAGSGRRARDRAGHPPGAGL